MTTIATVAVMVLPSEGRGGRHTDHGVAKSSNSAALTASRVRLPIWGSRSWRTRTSRYRLSGVLAIPVSTSLDSATGLTKWLACTRRPRSGWTWNVSSGAHSKSMATPSAWLTIMLLAADFGVAYTARM